MREVNAFDYWEHHASAIKGLGGPARSPDPRYVFHTRYHEVRAGRARFVLTLSGVRAGFGELSVRLHAWKPDLDGNVSLVSGARLIFDGEQAGEIMLPVRFLSQPRVLYALYGYLSEDSDVGAQGLLVEIDEPEDTGEVIPEPPRSLLALDQAPGETRPANALLHDRPAELGAPVSQSCTLHQLEALGVSRGESAEQGGVAIARWGEAVCLNALPTYGVTDTGLEGLVVGPLTVDGARQLDRYAKLDRMEPGPPPSRTSDEFVDFLLMPNGFAAGDSAWAGVEERWGAVEGWMARLKIGGMAVIVVRYRPENDLISSAISADAHAVTRNEIGQWVLRLIANGYSVAPMAFASRSELVVDDEGLAGFCLVAQRL